RAVDVAFGGQGAPIVPIGEKLLFKEFQMFLNIGGIANISFNLADQYIAFDICAANRVLNLIANLEGHEFDKGGQLAASGNIHFGLLHKLNSLDYYVLPFPKSLANTFGTDEVFPLVQSFNIAPVDALRTYVEHIVQQIINSIKKAGALRNNSSVPITDKRLLVTGGGAFNSFLINRLAEALKEINVALELPSGDLIKYKEALIMGFIGVLRWRQEYNVLSSVTGAERDSIGGAVWIGQEA
ncbi:MAG TPA: anhydro-N-acetylmuramic acid kinase, partial [Flavisolibacter sp.]|nr:anhydro-N-acetylmuramic acid kinase [Flavisolibacter sp.]